MADERGSTVYAAYIEDQLVTQNARKQSIEARGIAVITTSGVLVSLLFGLAAVLTGADNYQLPSGAEPWLYAALVGFVLAGIGGILANVPLFYISVNPPDLQAAVNSMWDDDPKVAEQRVAATRVNVLTRAKKLNNVKGYILMGAVTAEVLAVVFLALAIRVIIVHA
jgi:hypothetical protein